MNNLYRTLIIFSILLNNIYFTSSVLGMDKDPEGHRQMVTSRKTQEEQDFLFALSLQEGHDESTSSHKTHKEEQNLQTFLRDKETMLACYSDSPLMHSLYAIEDPDWAQRAFNGLVENFHLKGVSFSNSRAISSRFLPSSNPQDYYAGLLWTVLYGIEQGIKEKDMHRMLEEVVRTSRVRHASSMSACRTYETDDYRLAHQMQQEEYDRAEASARAAKSASPVQQEDADYLLAQRLQKEYELERTRAASSLLHVSQGAYDQGDPRDRFVLQFSKYGGFLHTSPGIRRVAQYDMEYPSIAVFHPYSIFTGENTRGAGNLVCRYAYQFHQPQVSAHLPASIRACLTDISPANISITFMTQNVPWNIEHAYGLLLRPHYLLFPEAPYKQEGYNVQETPEVGIFNLVPTGVITIDEKKNVLFPTEPLSAHTGEENEIVSSPDNLKIRGVDISQTVMLYSVVKAKGKAHVCLHWLLSDEDEDVISRIANMEPTQTLQFFMDQTQRSVRNGRESLREPLAELQRLLRTT